MKNLLIYFLLILLYNKSIYAFNALKNIDKLNTYIRKDDSNTSEKGIKSNEVDPSIFKKEKEKLLKKINKLKNKESELLKNNHKLENVIKL